MMSKPIIQKLIEVQEALDGKVVKDATANMGRFKYNFIKLDSLLDLVQPELRSHRLLLTFPCDGTKQGCAISDGENTIESWVEMKYPDDFQEAGKWMTYCRRYLLLGLLGAQACEDDDGAKSRGGEVSSKPAKYTKEKLNVTKHTPKEKPVDVPEIPSNLKDGEALKIWVDAHKDTLKALSPAAKKLATQSLKEKSRVLKVQFDDIVGILKG